MEDGAGYIINITNSTAVPPSGGKPLSQIVFETVLDYSIWVTIVLGGLGNALCLVIFYRRKRRRPNEIFIITLAVLDFVYCVSNGVYWNCGNSGCMGETAQCVVENYLYHFLTASTALTLFALTLDRYLAIFHVFQHKAHVTNKRCLTVVWCVMGTCVLLISPSALGCLEHGPVTLLAYMYHVNLLLVAADAAVILVMYARVYRLIHQYRTIRRRQTEMEFGGHQGEAEFSQMTTGPKPSVEALLHQTTGQRQQHQNQPVVTSHNDVIIRRYGKAIEKETKTTRICLFVSIVFLCFCLPSAALQAIWQLERSEDGFTGTKTFIYLLKIFYPLSTINTIANPMIYSISSSKFQQDLRRFSSDVIGYSKAVLCFVCCCGHRTIY